MALRPVVGFSLAGMASLLTRPFRAETWLIQCRRNA
jgi:hypothetical protein